MVEMEKTTTEATAVEAREGLKMKIASFLGTCIECIQQYIPHTTSTSTQTRTVTLPLCRHL